jgi:L-threonylcarbamoyladenylate synthase
MTNDYRKINEILKDNGLAVIPTDTLYGLVARAFSKQAVKRIYDIKGRDEDKPFIVLITRMEQLRDFGISLTTVQKNFLFSVWPGKVSVILPCTKKSLTYLHRGTESIAFRMVGMRNKNLYALIESVGPLVAPSANPQGLPPAKNRREARAYFGERVDGYVCTGIREGLPSTTVSFTGDEVVVVRKGSVHIK